MISVWNSVWNFVIWNDFSLKFCALKWFQSEILCSEMISVWNFVLWNDFSRKFCALKWFQSEIQSEILCSEMILVWNFVLWNDFSLKFCALKWIQAENLCSEINSGWNFVLWNKFSLKFCALNWNFFVPLGHRTHSFTCLFTSNNATLVGLFYFVQCATVTAMCSSNSCLDVKSLLL